MAEQLVASYLENNVDLERKGQWGTQTLTGAIVQWFVRTGGLVAIAVAAAIG